MTRRALITGGAGFIGSHVAEAYLADGWDVTVVDDLSRGREANVPARATFRKLDVRSPEARTVIAEGGFSVVNLQAAQIDVRHSVADPAHDASINLLGLLNLLEGAAAGGVRRVVFASSGGVLYGEADQVPTPESAPVGPVSPYGVSKLAGEHYLRCLAALRGLEWVALRYANVFGPRQDPRGEAGVVSIFLDRLRQREPLTVFGDGLQTRDYVYVRDVARANLLAATAAMPAASDHNSSAFNIGTGREISVLDLARIMAATLDTRPEVRHEAPRAGELARSALDAGKARQILGWLPAHSFEDGFRETVAWYDAETNG
ncbi:MAG TPA: NAD-dependent epimerase/dehydratase family protein [Gemmatimonadales bacterium]|nr:NAD-dependent epimerase/dehydratase family protein [Gemmatimonadales bacterium]